MEICYCNYRSKLLLNPSISENKPEMYQIRYTFSDRETHGFRTGNLACDAIQQA
jgi:hypothetical protein